MATTKIDRHPAKTIWAAMPYVGVTEAGPDAFVVEARVGGEWYFLAAPASWGVSFFTEAQAEKLAAKVRAKGEVDLSLWEPSFTTWEELADRWDAYAMEERMGMAA